MRTQLWQTNHAIWYLSWAFIAFSYSFNFKRKKLKNKQIAAIFKKCSGCISFDFFFAFLWIITIVINKWCINNSVLAPFLSIRNTNVEISGLDSWTFTIMLATPKILTMLQCFFVNRVTCRWKIGSYYNFKLCWTLTTKVKV